MINEGMTQSEIFNLFGHVKVWAVRFPLARRDFEAWGDCPSPIPDCDEARRALFHVPTRSNLNAPVTDTDPVHVALSVPKDL